MSALVDAIDAELASCQCDRCQKLRTMRAEAEALEGRLVGAPERRGAVTPPRTAAADALTSSRRPSKAKPKRKKKAASRTRRVPSQEQLEQARKPKRGAAREQLLDLVNERGEITLDDACTELGVKKSSLSYHVKALAEAGAIDTRKDGRRLMLARAGQTAEASTNGAATGADREELKDALLGMLRGRSPRTRVELLRHDRFRNVNSRELDAALQELLNNDQVVQVAPFGSPESYDLGEAA